MCSPVRSHTSLRARVRARPRRTRAPHSLDDMQSPPTSAQNESTCWPVVSGEAAAASLAFSCAAQLRHQIRGDQGRSGRDRASGRARSWEIRRGSPGAARPSPPAIRPPERRLKIGAAGTEVCRSGAPPVACSEAARRVMDTAHTVGHHWEITGRSLGDHWEITGAGAAQWRAPSEAGFRWLQRPLSVVSLSVTCAQPARPHLLCLLPRAELHRLPCLGAYQGG